MIVYPDLAILIGVLIHASAFRLTLLGLNLRRSVVEYAVLVICSGVLSGLMVLPMIPFIIPILFGGLIYWFFLRGKTVLGTLRNFGYGILILFFYLGCLLCVSGAFFGLSCLLWKGVGYFSLSFARTVISAVLSYLLLRIVLLKRKRKQVRRYCECVLSLEEKKIPFRSLVDTGNFLTDPLSGLSVVLLEFSLFRKYLRKDFPPPMTFEFATYFSHRARVIPYRTVSGEGEMLSAFLTESLTVNGVSQKAVIAVVNRPLESRGEYFGIVGPDLIGGD